MIQIKKLFFFYKTGGCSRTEGAASAIFVPVFWIVLSVSHNFGHVVFEHWITHSKILQCGKNFLIDAVACLVISSSPGCVQIWQCLIHLGDILAPFHWQIRLVLTSCTYMSMQNPSEGSPNN